VAREVGQPAASRWRHGAGASRDVGRSRSERVRTERVVDRDAFVRAWRPPRARRAGQLDRGVARQRASSVAARTGVDRLLHGGGCGRELVGTATPAAARAARCRGRCAAAHRRRRSARRRRRAWRSGRAWWRRSGRGRAASAWFIESFAADCKEPLAQEASDNDERTPILIGSGRSRSATSTPARRLEPVALMRESALRAAADAGLGRRGPRPAGRRGVVNILSWPYVNAPAFWRASRRRATRQLYRPSAETPPQWLGQRTAAAHRAGEVELALLAGADGDAHAGSCSPPRSVSMGAPSAAPRTCRRARSDQRAR